MLPGPADGAASLADVLRDCLGAVRGEPTRLGLPGVDRAAVLLVDGLGAENLRARAGHARTLAAALRGRGTTIDVGGPTTTAASLATLTTGASAGEHGIVGYQALEPATDRVVNQLRGWEEGLLPDGWQRRPTLFEAATASGLDAVVFGSSRYRESGFTGAVLRGARYVPGKTIDDRLDALGEALADRRWRGIAYAYVAELDMAGHDRGAASEAWGDALERLDAALGRLAPSLDRSAGLLITADHGMVDVPEHRRIVIPDGDALWAGVRHVAGEHRLLHLHLEPGASPDAVAAAWRGATGNDAWVATLDEALAAGWFGAVDAEVRPRIGDVLVAARRGVAYFTERDLAGGAGRMVGQHGSWTDVERRVPLLRFGAFG